MLVATSDMTARVVPIGIHSLPASEPREIEIERIEIGPREGKRPPDRFGSGSGNTERHRLSRAGNRQLNAAIHRVALTQARAWADARTYLDRRQEAGATRKEPIRSLKRRISDTIYARRRPNTREPSAPRRLT